MGMPLPATEDLAHAFDVVGAEAWRALSGQRIFLTGGTGFVGKWLIAAWHHANRQLDLGSELVVLSRDPEGFRQAEPNLASVAGLSLVRGDIRDFEFPPGRFGYVIHAAADVVAPNAPLDTLTANIDGTRRALEFAKSRDAQHFLLVSSGAVYGRQPPELDALGESYSGAPDLSVPGAAYGEGKRVAEWLTHTICRAHDTRFAIARCFAFVGPYLALDKQFAAGNFLRDAMARKEIVVQSDGTAYRSYLYAADLAAWLWAMALRAPGGAVYNVGSGEAISIGDLAHTVNAVLDSSAGVRILQTAAPDKLPERYVPNVDRIMNELHLKPPIALDDALARTARWHLLTRRPS